MTFYCRCSKNRSFTVKVFFAAAVLIFLPRSASAAVQAIYYASPTGSGNACTRSAPCSLKGARDKVRTVNSNMTGDIEVRLLNGTYTLTSTFTLIGRAAAHDSGTNGYNIIYKADTGAAPVISGGEVITDFTLHDAGKNIYKASVSSGLDTRQFYVNSVRAVRARGDDSPSGFRVTSTGFTLPSSGIYSNMASWGNPQNIEFAQKWAWQLRRYSVGSISGTAVTMAQPGWGYAHANNQPPRNYVSWVENAYELLDAPGEWYLDKSTDTLYYKPRSGENMSTAFFVAAKLETLVSGSGTLAHPLSNIQFKGIIFSYNTWLEPNGSLGYPDFQTGVVHRGNNDPHNPFAWSLHSYKTPGGVTFSNTHNMVIKNSTFTHMGNTALNFDTGSKNNLIDYNTFKDISGNGIALGGVSVADHHPSDERKINKGNVISNNDITAIGVEYYGTVGIFITYAQDTLIKHNTIYELPYSGITMGWGWGYVDTLGTPAAKNNTVRGNKIYEIMRTLKDGGSIYTLGKQFGSQVIDNYVRASHKHTTGYLYRDNGSEGFIDSNNVVSSQGTESGSTWYITNTSAGGYWNPNDNIAQNNFYSSGLTTSGTGGSNRVFGNTEVVNYQWPAKAREVINKSGVGGEDIEYPISQDKTATASTIYSAPYNASKGVDGSVSTRWAQQSDLADPSWLKVDLGTEYAISRVQTSAYLPYGRGMKYQIEYSTDDVTYSMYADKTSTYSTPGTDTKSGTVTARYMRITLTDTQGQGGSLYEFEVYGRLVPISQGKTAAASTIYSAAYDASKAVDGSAVTRWDQSGSADPSWFKVDLGHNYIIDRTYTAAYLPFDFGVKYKVEYSMDDVTYSMYADKASAYSVPGRDTNSSNVIARYMRITFMDTQGQGGSLYEFEVYGELAPISQGKTATASTIYSASYNASNAVDGSAATRWAQQGYLADPSWLKVDLGANYTISRVETSAYLHGDKGMKYKIEYSTDDVTYSTYADKTATYSVPGTDTNSGVAAARYMRITFTDTQGQGGSVYEFKVYDEEPPISLGKTATASTIYSAPYNASKAVDGSATTRWAQQGYLADPSWLKVDLGAEYTISRVQTAAYLHGGKGMKYKIEYSTDDVTYSTYADKTAAYSVPGTDTSNGVAAARYMRITFTDTQGQGGSVYEFKVYGQ